ncbi:Uncharacterised protein [Achromobacter xylosoxidans]|nr:Uncharacterised protein [Achromobacter xylosoxidans]
MFAGGVGKGGLQQRRRAAEAQSPQRHASHQDDGVGAGQAQRGGGQREQCQRQQRQPAQAAVHQHARQQQAGDRAGAEHQQHHVHGRRPAQVDQVGRDVGIEHVVRQDPGEQHEQDRPDAGQQQGPRDRQALARGLAGEVGHGRADPDHQRQRHGGHQPEHAAPVHQAAQPGAGRHAQAQRQRLARAHHRQGPALLAGGHHAARVASQQPPQQAGRHAAAKARRQRQRVVRRQRGHHVENAQAADGQQQQRAAVPAAGSDDDGNGRQHRAGREQGHQLAGQRLGHAQAQADLRQQAGGHGLGHDGDEARQRQGQQPAHGQAVGAVFGTALGGQGRGETHAETPIAIELERSFQKRTKKSAGAEAIQYARP